MAGQTCFPRTRGDGPVTWKAIAAAAVLFPPHARGWTPVRECIAPGNPTFPPHARGWTPAGRAVGGSLMASSFPRTRGDGPITSFEGCRARFPPHARGWTRASHASRCGHARVSPARAGMDPTGVVAQITDTSFPRTRGDGPASLLQSAWNERRRFPPHARGWTPGSELALEQLFPPHARGWTRNPRRHLPRQRAPFPPHARGWTLNLRSL